MNKDILEMYAPSVLLCDGMTAGLMIQKSHDNLMRAQQLLSQSLAAISENFDDYKAKVSYLYTPNNYRKMHHLPMRRRCKRSKGV